MAKARPSKKPKIRACGAVTCDMEPLLEELVDDHELQAHEIVGLIFNWIAVHRPDAIERQLDQSVAGIPYVPLK